MSAVRKLRVLRFHGFRTNDKVMMNQTRALREALGDRAEFSFPNGPFEARGPADETTERAHANDAPFYEWVAVKRVDKALLEEAAHNTTSITSPNKE